MAAIIFDFDGTIADSFDFIVDWLAAAAKQPKLSVQARQNLRGTSMAAIGRSFGHSWWRLLRLFFTGRQQMGRTISHLQPFAGMPEVIKKLHAEGHELFIVTSNSVRNVHVFLHHHNLHKYFFEIYGSVSLFGKAPALRRLLRTNKIELKDAVYIGDELRDVEAAQSLKLRIIAVSWGFARTEDLRALKPTKLVTTPDELISVLEEL